MFDFYTIFSLHQKLRYLIDLLGVSSQLTPPWYFLPTFWRSPKIGFLKILSACITLIKRVDEPFEEESIESCICKQDCLSRLENIFRDQRETENQSCNRFSKHFTERLNISKPWIALFQKEKNKAKYCNSKGAKKLIFNVCPVGHWAHFNQVFSGGFSQVHTFLVLPPKPDQVPNSGTNNWMGVKTLRKESVSKC